MRDLMANFFSWIIGPAQRKAVASTVAVSMVSSALVFAAVNSDGASATDVRLDDGVVWVSNNGLVGRLNVKIQELDFAVDAATNADVVQDGRNVAFSGRDGGVQRLDVVAGTTAGSNEASITDYQMAGGLARLHDRETGRLWIGPDIALAGANAPDDPDAILDEGAFSVIGAPAPEIGAPFEVAGSLFVIDSTGWWEMALDETFEPVRIEQPDVQDGADDATATTVPPTTMAPTPLEPGVTLPEELPEPILEPEPAPLPVPFGEIEAVTTVGSVLVVLASDGRVAAMGQNPTEVPGDGHRLQQPSGDADVVLVASTAGLFGVGLDDGVLNELTSGDASPAAPIRVGPCVFGAWSGETPYYFKQCGDTVLKDNVTIVGAAAGVELVWRVNQRNVALNSPGDGGVWADHEGTLAFAGNWGDVEPQDDLNDRQDDTTGESQRIVEKVCIDGTGQAPTAGDDELGVRPRQSIIEVLNNDDDINCEPIAITQIVPSGGPWGQLTIIDDGQHILYSPSNEMLQDSLETLQVFQFEYVVADSAGNESDPATVTVQVKDRSVGNVAPSLRPKADDSTRQMRTVVEAGRSVGHNVMADWWDADGDDLRLVGAVAQDAGEVTATPDGIVRFAANGVAAGVYQVDVTMSDGVLTAVEQLEVTVKPTGSPIPPVVENDFLTIAEGQTGTVSPLSNDTDPNEDSLELVPLWLPDVEGSFRTALQDGEVAITGLAAGTYSLPYQATDGLEVTDGYIRLEVRAPNEFNTGPIGVPDQVKVRAGRVVNIDVLDNDIDFDGDILAVTGVSVSDSPAEFGEVSATIVERRLVQIEVVSGPDGLPPTGPFIIQYTLDDGRRTERLANQTPEQEIAEQQRATGAVTVLVQPAQEDQPPQLEDDQATVRTGQVTRVAVLRNDTDPDADEITLESVDEDQAADLEATGGGTVWVQGRYVYFKGGTPGRVAVLYNARAGNRNATAEVVFQVTPAADPATNPNQAPSPDDLVVRAIRGGEVRVPVQLFGSDVDGDSVVLVDEFTGLQGVSEGNRVRVDPDDPAVILFEAGANAGPADTFSYTVRDPQGLTGTAQASVMILDDGGWPPQGHDDVFIGKPGRTLSIPVLANDTSPQDRRLEIAEEPFFDLEGQPSLEPVNGDSVTLLDQQDKDTRGRINVVVPVDGTTLTEHYRLSDGFSPGDAYVRVSADPDVPNVPPVAARDVITLEEIRGLEVGRVDVLANDYDPDDVGGGLILDMPASETVNPDGEPITIEGSELVIPLTELPQTVLYRITDVDGGQGIGFVRVPGQENSPPVLSDAGRDVNNRTIEAGSTQPLAIPLASIVEDPDGDEDIRLTSTEVQVLGTAGSVSRTDGDAGFVFTPPTDLQQPLTVVIQFEVTDRPEKTDDERALPNCNCLSLLEVEVLIEASSPPRILSTGSVSVPQLDEEVTYDLTPLSVDDQGDALTYTLDPSSFGGLDVTQNGPRLTIVSTRAEDAKLPLGSTIPIRYSVTDGNFDPVDNTVNVTIITTNRGQPATGVFPTLEAERDEPIATPNFIAAASNPFPDRPLTLVNSSVDGGASITCAENGDCQFLSNTVGEFTISYTVKDAVDQTANGSMSVVVKGKPRPPGIPAVVSVGNNVVSLSWTAADMQGGVFDRYVVTAVETGATMEFTNTGGEFDNGLVNGTAYTFRVYAINELGDGEVSDRSSAGIPDRVPDPPVNPQIIDYQDGALTLQWEPPPTASEFTAILEYEVSIGGQTISVGGDTTSVTVGNGGDGSPLINGTDYQFRVRARNSATVDNGWGAFGVQSASERPSRHPDAPTNVRASNTGDGGTPRLTVNWNAPGFDGGRPLQEYRVCQVQAPTNCRTVAGLSTTFDLPRNQDVSFTVIAFNSDKNRNNSDPSAPSANVRTVGNPDTPTISIQSSGDKTLTAIAQTTNNSGCNQLTIEYSRNGGGSWQTGGTFSGLTNGTAYTIVARATLAASCGTPGTTYRSSVSSGATATPYGPLQQPSIDVQVSGTQIRTTWNANRSDDGRPSWSVSLSGNAPGCSGSAASGTSAWVDVGYSATRSCTITVSASGVSSRSASDSAATPAPPPPPGVITITAGGTGCNGVGTCPPAGARWQNVSVSQFPNGTFTVRNSIQTVSNPSMTVTNGSGSVGDGWWWCFGGGTYRVTIVTPVATYTQDYVCRS